MVSSSITNVKMSNKKANLDIIMHCFVFTLQFNVFNYCMFKYFSFVVG